MNLTSGCLFYISICIIVMFWSHVAAARTVYPKLFHMASIYSSFVTYIFPSFDLFGKLHLLVPKDTFGFLHAERFSTPAEDPLVLALGLSMRSHFQLLLGNLSMRALRRDCRNKMILKNTVNIQLWWWMNVEQPQRRCPLNGPDCIFGQCVCQLFCATYTSNDS